MSRAVLVTLLTWTLALGVSGAAAADSTGELFADLVPGAAMTDDELATIFGAGVISSSDNSVTSFAISGASGSNRIRPPQLSSGGFARTRAALPSAGSMRFFFNHPNARPIPFASSF